MWVTDNGRARLTAICLVPSLLHTCCHALDSPPPVHANTQPAHWQAAHSSLLPHRPAPSLLIPHRSASVAGLAPASGTSTSQTPPALLAKERASNSWKRLAKPVQAVNRLAAFTKDLASKVRQGRVEGDILVSRGMMQVRCRQSDGVWERPRAAHPAPHPQLSRSALCTAANGVARQEPSASGPEPKSFPYFLISLFPSRQHMV